MASPDTDKLMWIYSLKKRILLGVTFLMAIFVLLTSLFIFFFFRGSYLENSRVKTQELGDAVKAGLKQLMLKKSPEMVQDILQALGNNKSSVSSAFIIDLAGKVRYSSHKEDIGMVIDRTATASCKACHQSTDSLPSSYTAITEDVRGERVIRNVNIIYNEQPCIPCHQNEKKIIGKFIIDRPLGPTDSYITTMGLAVFGSGLLCIIIFVPVVSKKIDLYIHEITTRNEEITLLYTLVDRLSKSIKWEELKDIVAAIIMDSLHADEVFIIIERPKRKFRVVSRYLHQVELERKKIDDQDVLADVIYQWMDGKLPDNYVDGSGKRVFMPVAQAGQRLALIVAIKLAIPFHEEKLSILKAMSGHIAIAFENARLYALAITDELTCLYTKRHFSYTLNLYIESAISSGAPFTLLVLDIDHFKKINDTYGHATGDEVLKMFAQCLLDSVRVSDGVFRYGGEEFTVLLTALSPEEGITIAQRIRNNIAQADFSLFGIQGNITTSIGVAHCPEDSLDAKELFSKADKALYEAKKTGRNKVVCASGL